MTCGQTVVFAGYFGFPHHWPAVITAGLDDRTQVDSKPAGQPEHAGLNQCQLIAPLLDQNWCPADDGDQVSLSFNR